MLRICEVLEKYRWATRQTQNELAENIGLPSGKVLGSIERGQTPTPEQGVMLMSWLYSETDAVFNKGAPITELQDGDIDENDDEVLSEQEG